MKHMKELTIIGSMDMGKTTLANALLGWDLFPQAYDYLSVPTLNNQSRILPGYGRITDTPGYSLLWNEVPEDVVTAVDQADTVIVLLSEILAEEGFDLSAFDPDWEQDREAEKTLLEKLLAGRTRDIYFVIPYDSQEWGEEPVPLSMPLRLARQRFSCLTDRGEAGFFCIDPMKALIGAIEADGDAVAQSGILELKAALGMGGGC